jgi:hypothetical protein
VTGQSALKIRRAGGNSGVSSADQPSHPFNANPAAWFQLGCSARRKSHFQRRSVLLSVEASSDARGMKQFIKQETIRHYRKLLERTSDPAERQRIERLLAEEEENT